MRWWVFSSSALWVALSCSAIGWVTPPAKAQTRPAAQWCADILGSRPTPTPIVDLYNRVRGGIEPKGEFETTGAFELRVEGAIQKIKAALIHDYGSSRVVAMAPIHAPYDADKEFFTVGSMLGEALTGSNIFETETSIRQDFELVAVESRPRHKDDYVGQNAYGATRVVRAEKSDEYGIALPELRLIKSTSWLRRRFIIPLPPERAQALGGRLSVLIVGELGQPGAIDGYWRSSPTLQNPQDVTINKRYVALKNACGAIVATDTREILSRLN
jgi:hypothetical protein